MKDRITAIILESKGNKINKYYYRGIAEAGMFSKSIGDVKMAFVVPDILYHNGVRAFVYSIHSVEPIDLSTATHYKLSARDLARISDNSFMKFWLGKKSLFERLFRVRRRIVVNCPEYEDGKCKLSKSISTSDPKI